MERHPAVRILVVDDFAPFRRFLRDMLEARPELHVVDEASDGFEAVQKAQSLQPDLILLDIGLPTLNGIETARRILRLVPDARILFISQVNDADVIVAALATGGKGFVRKQNAAVEVLPAVEAICDLRFAGDRGLSGSNHAGKPRLLTTPGKH